MTKRNGKISQGSHEYKLHEGLNVSKETAKLLPDNYTACRMGNNEWYVFRNDEGKLVDMGVSLATLRECRNWYLVNVAGIF